jgi:P-type Ca2+ transporter type 2C
LLAPAVNVYLQHLSDLAVWWSPSLLWSRPRWVVERKIVARAPPLRWHPIVTFWQVTGDLLFAIEVPAGPGHRYRAEDLAAAWAVLTSPAEADPMERDPAGMDPAEVSLLLGTDPERGLSRAQAAQRLAGHGPNEIVTAAPVPAWRLLLRQFQDALIYLLLGAVAVSLTVWLVGGAQGWPVDAVVIVAIVVLNAVLGYAQEQRAEQAVAALRRMTAVTASVVRDGQRQRVPAREVVTGDLLVLAEGDAVAADARLVRAATLRVSEASLTGESEAVLKDAETLPGPVPLADRLNMVFSGTAVMQGSGLAVVTATGMGTEMGRIAELLHRTEEEPAPLQREISRLGRVLGLAVVVIAAVVVGTVLLTSRVADLGDVVTVFLLGVALAVAAVPEGLPAILSVVLAIGVRRLAAHHAIVKRLSSVETLGSASVICSDKTGTLTRGEMTVGRVVTASGQARVSGVGYQPQGQVEPEGGGPLEDPLRHEVAWVLGGGCLASDAALSSDGERWRVQGDPTEGALLVAERKMGDPLEREQRFRRVGQVPFTSERKMMTSLEADAARGGRVTVVTKGAPEVLLRRCTHRQVGAEVMPMDDRARQQALAEVDRLSSEAFRTLAVAHRPLELTEVPEPDASLEQNLIYIGVVGIIDPPRAEVAEAIRQAHRAGVRIIMITGDHPLTAARIAADLGIVEAGAPVLTGADLSRMRGEELVSAVRRTSVYARVAPQHKLDIVDALQADGNIVAMTGDGVNDAPALKSADIGIAMGITGTEVTKEAARMVLADDNFATIVRAVRQGRDIFDNIKKFLRYLLSSNLGEVLTVFLGVVAAGVVGLSDAGEGLVLPLLVTQILWINLLTDSGLALAMGVDPEIDDAMKRPPRRLDEGVIDVRMWGGVMVIGSVMAVAALLTMDLYLPDGLIEADGSLDRARTAGFTVLVLAQLFNSLNARSEVTSAFHQMFANRWLWAAIALVLLLQVAVVHLPALNVAFGTTSLTAGQWLVCVAMASTVLWAGELRKLMLRTGKAPGGAGAVPRRHGPREAADRGGASHRR